ncbi:MAG: hypothetical protein L0Z49_06705 [Actinobacteria bacterium]|nr:hypothetical protein [Actinomycetota bacterium]
MILVACGSESGVPESDAGDTGPPASVVTWPGDHGLPNPSIPSVTLNEGEVVALLARLAMLLDACADDLPCQGEAMDEFSAECLTVAGFPTYLNSDGNWATETGGRDQEFFTAVHLCDERMNTLLPPPTEITEEYLSDYYDFLVELKECVEAQRFFVEDPPSREAFIENPQWHPYEHVSLQTAEEYAALEEVCPQNFTPD